MKKIIYILVFCLFFNLFSLNLCLAASDATTKAAGGLETSASTGYGVKTSELLGSKDKGGIPGLVGVIVGSVLAFVGIIFFVLMIYGGFTWMTAGGNEQTITKAKDIIFSAAIGLIIVLAAYAFTKFLGSNLLK